MNTKEISELRRRFRPERGAISRVYGCFVTGCGGIASYIDTSLGMLTQDEAELYLGLLKKALSGPGAGLTGGEKPCILRLLPNCNSFLRPRPGAGPVH